MVEEFGSQASLVFSDIRGGFAMVATEKCREASDAGCRQKPGKKLLDHALDSLRADGLDERSAGEAVSWMRRYILFHGKRHPNEMGIHEVDCFLSSADFAGRNGSAAERKPSGPCTSFTSEYSADDGRGVREMRLGSGASPPRPFT